MRTSRALLGAVTAAVAIALLIGSPASAAISIDGDDVIIDSLTADYTLGRGAGVVSALTAAETYVVRFAEPVQTGGVGRQVVESANGTPRHPRLISITEPDGAEWPSEVESADGVYTMTAVAPDGLRGRQSFVFTYTVDGVVSVGDDRGPQEFVWAVNGSDGSPTIGEVRATLRVPADLVPTLTGASRCLIGPEGAAGPCDLELTPGQLGAVMVEASARDLSADETMTLVVEFAPGTFAATEEDGGTWLWWVAASTGAGALAVAYAVLRRRRNHVDDPHHRSVSPTMPSKPVGRDS
ncbi:DUF2207 domain-containing protein [Microbacterium kunmingense]|uniref:DUF2207 domain-containing protein n=1 Tax=Microbacterium kunmingense TaxID=2915939 RepID=UPI002003AE4F|nr:DUF2207 domain-containing protein [Microbacterium kunmingense]